MLARLRISEGTAAIFDAGRAAAADTSCGPRRIFDPTDPICSRHEAGSQCCAATARPA